MIVTLLSKAVYYVLEFVACFVYQYIKSNLIACMCDHMIIFDFKFEGWVMWECAILALIDSGPWPLGFEA